MSKRKAEPGMMGGGARPGATRFEGVPRLEKEEAAERGRGEAALGALGSPWDIEGPRELATGTKSNRGARSGATPY